MITEYEMENYLFNYDASEPVNHFKLKDLFSKDGRERITEEIKDKHPKVKKALDKHPILEKAVKTAMAATAAQVVIQAAAGAAAAAYFGAGAIGAGSAGSLAVFKPAMVATLKSKGEATNGLPLKDIVAKFLKANGKTSKSAGSDFGFISDYFAAKMGKAKRDGASPEDTLINNLIDGTAKAIQEKGGAFLSDLITGNDAAPDSPLAPEAKGGTPTEMPEGGDKKNMYLILGAIVLIVIFAAKK
jgi:hypothetical protein